MIAGNHLREELAAVQHEIWSHWMAYLFTTCDQNEDGSVTIPAELVSRWAEQLKTHYIWLSLEEQESDRHQADKVLAVLGGNAMCREIVSSFVDQVNVRAEATIARTNTLEGAHYAAMQAILKDMWLDVTS